MKKITTILGAALVSFIVLAAILLLLVRDTALQAIAPFQQANSKLGTEVAKVLNPTPTILPDPVTIIHEVRSLARLETIQYSVEKVISGDSGQTLLTPLFGDRLLFVAHGTVIAGVDLRKLVTSDLQVAEGFLKIRLPEPEIFAASLNNEKSYVFDRQTGVLTHGNPNLETQVRRVAEQDIYNAALKDGILGQARLNAENYLISLLHNLGYKNVMIINSTPVPATK